MLLQRIAYAGILLFFVLIAAELTYVSSLQRTSDRPVIRIAVASWQVGEMPFESFAQAYEKLNPDVRIELKMLPNQSENKLIMLWQRDRTPYDLVIAYADEEIHTFIGMDALEPVENLLTPEQLDEFLPASLAGSTTIGPDGEKHHYMIPFTVEMMCLNVRRDILKDRGIGRLPSSYADLENMAGSLQGLTSGNLKVWPVAADFGQGVFFGQNFYIPMLADLTDGKITDERGRLDISSDAARQVFVTLRRWYDQGMVSNASNQLGQADRDFQGGLAVMYPHWQSRGQYVKIAFAQVNPDLEVAIYPAPGADRAGSLTSCYGAFIPKASPNKRVAADVAFQMLSQWIQPAVAASGKLPPVQSVYDRGFDRDPPWLERLREMHADVPADQRPGWLKNVEQVYAEAKLPDWMVHLQPSLLKGYSFPDVTMWGKVAPLLAITFQEWLMGTYGDNVDAAMAKLQERVQDEYSRADILRQAVASRREQAKGSR